MGIWMDKGKMYGKCALCDKENVVLELSHIIQNFVLRRIIKKSPSGFMSSDFNPYVWYYYGKVCRKYWKNRWS